MKGPSGDTQGGFLNDFAEPGMAMAGAGDVFRRTTELHRDNAFLDEIARFGPNNVHTEYFVGFLVG